MEKIRNSNNSYDIENLGHESVEIIKSIADSTFFSSLKLFQDSSIGNIEYTINKEVKKAGRYGLSTRQKNEAMNDAKNKLSWDIKEFKLRLDNFDVNG